MPLWLDNVSANHTAAAVVQWTAANDKPAEGSYQRPAERPLNISLA